MTDGLLTALYALGATLAWGSGDFSGGLVSRHHNVYSVLLTAQLISVIPLLLLAVSFEQVIPRNEDLLLGGLGGFCGIIGLRNLYLGLAKGRMSIVAPLSAIISSVIPVLLGILADGLPGSLQFSGFALALVAVGLLSTNGQGFDVRLLELRFAAMSGVGFAFFFVFLDRVSGETILWPVLAARISSLIALSLYTVSCRQWQRPAWSLLPLITLAGLLDTAGNYCFAMAAQSGRLDIATIISCLYPGITVILARAILKERLQRKQWFGIWAAFIAIVMIVY